MALRSAVNSQMSCYRLDVFAKFPAHRVGSANRIPELAVHVTAMGSTAAYLDPANDGSPAQLSVAPHTRIRRVRVVTVLI
jgi:hypothetical protein